MSYPLSVKEKATKIRKSGISINKIAADFGLSKSTVSLWMRDVVISDSAKRKLAQSSEDGRADGRLRMAAQRKIQAQADRAESIEILNSSFDANDRNSWRLVGSMLYWCEGTKARDGILTFVNSDPAMIKTYLRAIRKGYDLNELKFRAIIHLHEYHDPREQLLFWSSVTGIPTTQFYRPYIKPHTGRQKRSGYPGCISIRYADAGLARKVKSLYGVFAE